MGEAKRYRLVSLSGPDAGASYPMDGDDLLVGRSSRADVRVLDRSVSRAHCRLTRGDDGWRVEDLNTTNGTWVQGQPVHSKAPLPLQAAFRIGEVLFEIRNGEAPPPVESEGVQLLAMVDPVSLDVETTPVGKPLFANHSASSDDDLRAVSLFQGRVSALNGSGVGDDILEGLKSAVNASQAKLFTYDVESGEHKLSGDLSLERNRNGEDDVARALVDVVARERKTVLAAIKGGRKRALAGDYVVGVALVGGREFGGVVCLRLDAGMEAAKLAGRVRLLTLLGHLAAVALERRKILQFNKKNERLLTAGVTAAQLSHYIKNVLYALDGSLSVLRKGHESGDLELVGEAWSILSINHRKLGNLVRDILNVSKEQTPRLRGCDLRGIVRGACDLLKAQLEYSGIELRVETTDLPIPIVADPDGLHRVFLNLVTNSEQAILAKQGESGVHSGGRVLVVAKVDENSKVAELRVEDDGVGLEEGEAEKIFDVFETSKGITGTGLGLHVSSKIVRAHGGTITAKGRKGEGCAVTVHIPLATESVVGSETTLFNTL